MFLFNLIKALDKHKVPYAIVGGYAVALHGAVRGTMDVDLILRLTEADFAAAEKAFATLGLQSRLPLNAKDLFLYRDEYIKNRNLVAWSFYNPQQQSQQVDIIITHDLSELKTKSIKLKGLTIKVLAIDALIDMKRQSGRPQDIEDIKALKRIRDHEK